MVALLLFCYALMSCKRQNKQKTYPPNESEKLKKEKRMAINLQNKGEIIKKFGENAKDSGNIKVQIALLSEKISQLTEHLKTNAKDFQGKRGLLMMVGRRKRLLSYLKDKNLEEYRTIIKKLNIRK